MKSNLTIFSYATFFMLLLSIFQVHESLKAKTQTFSKEKGQDAELEKQWKQLFTKERDTKCSNGNKVAHGVKSAEDEIDYGKGFPKKTGWGTTRPSFHWVKKWGYGPVAWLFDFLDPVFRQDFLIEAEQIIKDFSKLSKDDTDDYEDAFKLSAIAPKNNKLLSDNDFKAINPKFSKANYEKAVNAVQLNKAIEDWSWSFTNGSKDPAFDFIVKYDINGDGRMDPYELILGVIWTNKKREGLFCYDCFFLLSKKIGAMFEYMDCSKRGYLEAEDLWNKFPSLHRKEKFWDIFSAGNSDTIRTNSVNDFILKNSNSIDAAVTKDEFVTGILLGFWQRQISEDGLLKDDKKNLKDLRWINKTHDIIAQEYIEAQKKIKAAADE